jgi:LacI family transcriptional regulator
VLGVLAWGRMKALIKGATPDHNVVFQPRLEVRRSTAAPPV